MQNLADEDQQPLSHLTVPALPRHAYVCHRHYSSALAQGSLYKVSADPKWAAQADRGCKNCAENELHGSKENLHKIICYNILQLNKCKEKRTENNDEQKYNIF